MKRYLTIFVLFCTIGTVHGAHFSYYAGGFRAFYEVYAQQDYPYLYDGPRSQTQDHITAAGVAGYAAVPQAESSAHNAFSSKTSNNYILINLYSKSDCTADNSDSYTAGWGYGTTQYYQNYGIFYKIMPDANEQVGDDAIVYYNDLASVKASGTTHLVLGGPGTMDHIAITRGQLPPVTTEPLRENEVLRFPYVELSNSFGDWFSNGVHAFPAKIGDVIGIFAQNFTDIYGWGYRDGLIESSFTMILTVETVLLGDLDYDDDVDLYDLAKLANNWLIDIGYEPQPDTTPPEPNPMQWAEGGEPKEIQCSGGYCATMTAKTATDPSGGIQYFFECTDESGFNSDWQGSSSYTVLVSIYSGQDYSFRVKARDLHGNETAYSPALPMN